MVLIRGLLPVKMGQITSKKSEASAGGSGFSAGV
jgi:hypothetical protein